MKYDYCGEQVETWLPVCIGDGGGDMSELETIVTERETDCIVFAYFGALPSRRPGL